MANAYASGSMSLYTAFFVRFLHGVVDAFREAEAFVFHTRLAHVSASLRDRDVARAVDRLSLMAQGIGGGTRIGESIATFNRWHARRVINAGKLALSLVRDPEAADDVLHDTLLVAAEQPLPKKPVKKPVNKKANKAAKASS